MQGVCRPITFVPGHLIVSKAVQKTRGIALFHSSYWQSISDKYFSSYISRSDWQGLLPLSLSCAYTLFTFCALTHVGVLRFLFWCLQWIGLEFLHWKSISLAYIWAVVRELRYAEAWVSVLCLLYHWWATLMLIYRAQRARNMHATILMIWCFGVMYFACGNHNSLRSPAMI